jgi:hypothetical protein
MPATPDDILALLRRLQDVLPNESTISLSAILRFMSLAKQIKNDIILVQLGDYNPSFPPNNLSNGIIKFLAASCDIHKADVPIYWSILKSAVWTGFASAQINNATCFEFHGHKHGICKFITISSIPGDPNSIDLDGLVDR